MAFFGDLETTLSESVTQATAEAMSNVAAAVSGPFQIAMILYVIIYGTLIVTGRIQEPVMDAVLKIIKLSILSALIVGTAYVDRVVPLLSEQLPRELSQTVSGVDLGSPGRFFDEMVARVGALSEELSPSWVEVGLHVQLAIARVLIFVIAAIGFLVFFSQKLILLLLVAIGPICVALFLFEQTRRFFYGWMSQAVNTLLTLAILFLVLSFFSGSLASLSMDEGLDPGSIVLFYVAFALITLGVLLQVPGLASGIAGGFASAAGMGAAHRGSDAARNVGGRGTRAGAAVAVGLARRLYQKLRGGR